MKLLITGGAGKLGRELKAIFPDSSAPSRQELDIRHEQAVDNYVRKTTPDAIIHAAAVTGIRQCEEDKPQAWTTNVQGTENLVHAFNRHVPNAYFVHISTACVFDGGRGEYTEDDIPNPKNYYSLTKLVAEAVVRNSGLPTWLIVRTNFVAREKWPYPKAFSDRFGTYLFADDLAAAIKQVMEKKLVGPLHVCGSKKMSMYELAKLTTKEVEPMTLNQYTGPPLTVDMTLRSRRIQSFPLREELAPIEE